MRFTATILILILAQTLQKPNPERYKEFVRKADLIAVAEMTESKLVAEGKKTSWTVVYEVKEVLKGEYSAETLKVKLDSESFQKPAKAGDTRSSEDSLLILFLVKSKEQSFRYGGPALNSPEIEANPENVAAVRAEIDRQAASRVSWYDAAVVGVILVAGFVIAVMVLAFLVHKRRQISTGSTDS